jgi:transcriptional regulator with XRE-family HTH domain
LLIRASAAFVNKFCWSEKMTPMQSRAARALLEMTQGQLARAAGVGLSTVVDFERVRRRVSKEAMDALQAALEQAGIEFIDEGNGGVGVRLMNRSLPRSGRRKK